MKAYLLKLCAEAEMPLAAQLLVHDIQAFLIRKESGQKYIAWTAHLSQSN